MSGQGIFSRITRRLMQMFSRSEDEREDEVFVTDLREVEALPPLPMPQRDTRALYLEMPAPADISQENPPQMPGWDFTSDSYPLSYEGASVPEDDSHLAPRISVARSDMNPIAAPVQSAPLPIAMPYSPPELNFPEPYAPVPKVEAPDYADALLRRISWDERRYPQSMEDA